MANKGKPGNRLKDQGGQHAPSIQRMAEDLPSQQAPQVQLPTASSSPDASGAEKQLVRKLIGDLEKARGCRAIVYWVADVAKVSQGVVAPLFDTLAKIGPQERLDMYLYTLGGDAEAPWRIVTLIREYCNRFSILVPFRANSAGTLLTMGADEIVMTPLSILGPIDPSRTHPLLPRREGAVEAEPISVQDMRHAMQFIMSAAGPGKETSYTPEALAQIFTALFDKIHPLAIGAIEQSYALAKLIGTRCLGTHMDPTDQKEEIKRIVDILCDELKSHLYPIGRREAREIGLKVVDATADTEAAMLKLLKFYTARPVVVSAAKSPSAGLIPKGQVVHMHMAWLDSTSTNFRVEGKQQAVEDGQLRPLGDKWVEY